MRRVINVLAALLVSAAVLALFAVGYGPVPALGRALVPGHGAWASAPGGQPIHSQTLSLPGLAHPVSVAFTSHGVASVRAADEADVYFALGYLHARFRLTEMDLERRLGEGRIAQLAGPAGLSSDKFELRLGLLRTAQAEWAATPRTSPAGRTLIAYSHGVNDYLAQARRTGDWPSLFGLTGVYPPNWTPVDTLVLQGLDDPSGDVVGVVPGVVELQVGHRPSRAADRFSVHPADEADERLRGRKKAQDVLPLVVEGGTADLDQPHVVGAGFPTQSAHPVRVEPVRGSRHGVGACS